MLEFLLQIAVLEGEALPTEMVFPGNPLRVRFSRPAERIIRAPPPDLARLELPYELYTDQDLQHRLVYVEAARGCPLGCEYCLSSIEPGVRRFPLETILPAFERLLARGARRFKFVDRTFNLDLDFGRALLEFWYARQRPGLEVHFEIVPQLLTDDWLALLGRAPPGLLRLEVGGRHAFLEPDLIAFRLGGQFRVIEIKSFPVIDGQADGAKVAAAAIQSAVYVLALRDALGETAGRPGALSRAPFWAGCQYAAPACRPPPRKPQHT